MTNTDYDALAAELTDPGTVLQPAGVVLAGSDAAAAGRALMLQEYGSEDALEVAMRPGRPAVGREKHGASPTVRGRITLEDRTALDELRARTGKSESALVRAAIHQMLVEQRLLSA